MEQISLQSLQDELRWLAEKYSIVGVKAGTEIEAMSFDDINIMREVSENLVPMTVKIGGPEARNDIDYMLSIGVDTILAPMVESPYSLSNFVKTMLSMDTKGVAKLAVNIETIYAYNNLKKIFDMPEFAHIDSITVGRTDLSASAGKLVDSSEIMSITREIIDMAKSHGKKTSVGGKIMPDNAGMIQAQTQADTINTRHVIISCSSENIVESVYYALQWEKDFYVYLKKQNPLKANFYDLRVTSIENRIDSIKNNSSCLDEVEERIICSCK